MSAVDDEEEDIAGGDDGGEGCGVIGIGEGLLVGTGDGVLGDGRGFRGPSDESVSDGDD